jgi:hypothetical protein
MTMKLSLTSLFLFAASLVACSSGEKSSSTSGAATGGGGEVTAKFFLPPNAPGGDATNTSAPSVEIDANDGIHTVYPAYAIGSAFYAYCAPGCTGPDQVKVVQIPTDGTVHNAMIALDGSGKPQLLLSSAQRIYYASCEGDCTEASSWTSTVILEHGGEREVTGEAFALDPQGRPRFMMHTYKAYLGIGQKTPETFFVQCDADCNAPDAWSVSKISSQMWRASSLKYDTEGRAHVAMVANVDRTEYSSGKEVGAYAVCEAGCDTEDGWVGTALGPAFESELDAVSIKPAISLALTKAGTPRIIMLGMFEETLKRNLTYFECDSNCTGQGWIGSIISDHEKLGAGLDLSLDANDHPRFVHTLDYNIALAFCDEASCAQETSKWDLAKVEYGGEMKPDEIYLYDNCTVSAWFLHSPSLALTKDGKARVGYQARDISGGFGNTDPTRLADCRAGTDMTWSRLAVMQ